MCLAPCTNAGWFRCPGSVVVRACAWDPSVTRACSAFCLRGSLLPPLSPPPPPTDCSDCGARMVVTKCENTCPILVAPLIQIPLKQASGEAALKLLTQIRAVCEDGGPESSASTLSYPTAPRVRPCKIGTDCQACQAKTGSPRFLPVRWPPRPLATGGTSPVCDNSCASSGDGQCTDGGPKSVLAPGQTALDAGLARIRPYLGGAFAAVAASQASPHYYDCESECPCLFDCFGVPSTAVNRRRRRLPVAWQPWCFVASKP